MSSNQSLLDEHGGTAIEYGLIAALVAIALIAALSNMNETMLGLYAIVQSITLVL